MIYRLATFVPARNNWLNKRRRPLIITLNMIVALPILRAMGFPSREGLASWIEELHPEIAKRLVGKAAATFPKAEAVKQAAVFELCTGEESARVLAQKVGVSRPMSYKWKTQLLVERSQHHEAPKNTGTKW